VGFPVEFPWGFIANWGAGVAAAAGWCHVAKACIGRERSYIVNHRSQYCYRNDYGVRASKTSTALRQKAILAAALRLIADNGIRRLSISAIAREVGLVPSGLYRHYRSKDAIIDALLEIIGGRLARNLQLVKETRSDAVEKLRLLHARHVELVSESRGIPRLVFAEDTHGDNPRRKVALHGIISGYLAGVADIARLGQAEGCVRRDTAPETVALMFLGLIQPGVILSHISDGALDLTHESERCWHLFADAVRNRPSREGHRRKGERP